MIVGMDFGTTNSGMAVYDGKQVNVLPLDPSNANPKVIRTAIYVTNQQTIHIGRTAVDEYFEQNIGRSIKLQRVWVGEIEVMADLVYFVQDIYVWMDVLSPGRLFLSMKTGLRDVTYAGTVIGQFFYTLEDLIALYLTTTRLRAEQMLGKEVREVVLGRPVHFAFEPENDRIAQRRLLAAAFKAGYEKVYFEYEPIAAAYSYETTLTKPENVLVFDFGGGTLDITVARLGGGERQVLANGGIPVAGDVFDQKISRAKLPKHFGEGSIFGSRAKPLPVPSWIYDVFGNWQEFLTLQKPENIKILDNILATSRRPGEIQALRNLAASNYGLKVFDRVEQAKRQVSERSGATIKIEGDRFKVFELLTRNQFEAIIRKEIERIDTHLDETLAKSGLKASDIDAVIRTGGSSEIPAFIDMLAGKFGAEKLKAIDTFSSVTAGLGVLAHHIEQGVVEKQVYTPENTPEPPRVEHEQNIPMANVSLLMRRVAARENPTSTVGKVEATHVLFLLNQPKELHVTAWQENKELSLTDLGWHYASPPRSALLAPLDDQIVILTSQFRFLLTSGRQLLDLENAGMSLPDLYNMKGEEQLFVMANWTQLRQQQKMVLVTSLGVARAYELRVLVEAIENPIPYRFDNPPEGFPFALLGATRQHDLILATDNGRMVRFPLAQLPNIGGQVFNRKDSERLVGAIVTDNLQAEYVAVTHDGYGRLFTPEMVAVAPKLYTRGKTMVARKGVMGIMPAFNPLQLLTTQQLHPLSLENVQLDDSTRTDKIVKLKKTESIITPIG